MSGAVITPDVIIGTLTVLGACVVALNKLGLVNFGRQKKEVEKRSCPGKVLEAIGTQCEDHKIVMDVIKRHEEGSLRREKKIDEILDVVNVLTQSVSSLEGFLQGRNGYHK